MTESDTPGPEQTPAAQEQADAAAAAESDRIARLRARSAGQSPSEMPAPEQPSAVAPVAAEADGEVPPRFATPPPSPTTGPATAAPPTAAPTPPAPAPPAVATPAAASSSAATTPEAPDDLAPVSAPRGRWAPASPRLAVAVATAVLAVTATALAGVVTTHVSADNAAENTRTDVIGAATSGVATVLSYDYRHLDADFAAAEHLLTPKFRKQYDDTTAKGVKPLAAKYQAISSADVAAAGVVEAGSDRAVVLVFVDQTVTNSQLTAPRLDRSRIDVTLVRSNGRWLIDKLTTL